MNKLLIVLFTVLNASFFAQVTVTTSSCLVNPGNITVASCGTINLGSNSSVNASMVVNVSKPTNLGTGNSSSIKLFYRQFSGGLDQYITQVNVMESFWSPNGNGVSTYGTTLTFPLQASNFNTSGGCIVAAFVSSSNMTYYSCVFPVIRDQVPTFSLSPSSISIPCGIVSSKTFSVTAANIPAGANVTYNWNYSGWTGTVNNTMSSVTLTPTSSNSLPSNVSVTPYVNGVSQGTMICTVNRAAFTTSATIAGNPVICEGSSDSYTLNGLGAGNSVVWSNSNSAVASISSTSGNQVTVNGISNGLTQLTATITNPCGQTATVTKSLNIGIPAISSGVDARPLWLRKIYNHTLTCPETLGATSYEWTITPDLSSFSCPSNTTQAKFVANGAQTIVTTTPSVVISSGSCITDYSVTCEVTNTCGAALIYERYLTVGVSGSSPCNTSGGGLTANLVIKNPVSKGQLMVKRTAATGSESEVNERDITYQPGIVANDGPCEGPYPAPATSRGIMNNLDLEEDQYELKIYDLMGRLVMSRIVDFSDSDEYVLNDTDLRAGKYIVQISNHTDLMREIIIVED